MPEGHVLEFAGVTKRFGPVTAVDAFSARVEPGVVTGFLGPNGAGKTTSLRILLGLISASDGAATIGGRRYSELTHPLQTVGAALEASSFHPGRTAANHLKVYAHAAGIPVARVDDALGTVGLADVAGRKVGGFSLGMRQRLGLAYTLLGDPGVLVLDEPSNGLDPEGIKWMRGFLRELARQGRTVLVSSHLLSEIQQTAQSVLIIARGRLVFQGSLGELTADDEQSTLVDAPDREALASALSRAGLPFDLLRTGLTVRGVDPTRVGAIAAEAGVALSSLQRRGPALEEIFLDLVNGVRVHTPATEAPAAETPATEAPAADTPAEVEPPVDTDDETGTDVDVDVDGETDVEGETDGPAPAATDADAEADRFFARYDAPDPGQRLGDTDPPADHPGDQGEEQR
jgi:ABC-2 type transport system ATP-binding protein